VRIEENVNKGCQYTSVVYNNTASDALLCGNDGFIRQVSSGSVSEISQGSESRITSVNCGKFGLNPLKLALFNPSSKSVALAGSGSLLFGGAANGAIRIFSYPLQNNVAESPYKDYQAHAGPVTTLRIVDKYLFTAAEDGAVFVFKILPAQDNFLSKSPVVLK
jgi:WD40 repeat protein